MMSQGQGQGAGSAASGGEGEGGTPLIPIGPGDIITITSARRMEYPLPDVLEAPYQTPSGWRQKKHTRKAIIGVNPGEQYVISGQENPKVFWGSGTIAKDSNLGVDGEVGIWQDTMTVVWIAGGASGPQFETAWRVNLDLMVSDLVTESSVPAPASATVVGFHEEPNGDYIVEYADGHTENKGKSPDWEKNEQAKRDAAAANARYEAAYQAYIHSRTVSQGGVLRDAGGPLLPADGLLGVGAIGIILLLMWAVTRDG